MNDLNHLLRDWVARNESTSAKLDQLQTRITQRLANVGRTSVTGRTDMGVQSTTGWIALVAVAASLLAAVTVFRSGHRNESARPADIATESLPPTDWATRQTLSSELDRLFDGHWRWLGEVNGRVHLQTDETTSSAEVATNSGVAVRLMIVQRRPSESNWRVVWEASVLARSEEWVRLPAELTGDGAVSMWTYSLPDGSVLVESDLTLTAPVPIRLSEQQVFGASVRPARLWSTRRADGEFQLIQSIARLEANHG
jgi:hypothetical protein